jgi:leader peptidase (prepilin peptidase)/N-methyltransferase
LPTVSDAVAALVAGGAALLAAPYLARLTVSVPDKGERAWWRWAPVPNRRIAATALVALGYGGLAGGAAGWTALLPAFVLLALVCAPLAVIDFETHRLPNRLVFLGAGGGAVLLAAAAAVDDAWRPLLRAAEGAAAVFAVLFLIAFIQPKGFGLGDVKIGGVLGGYLGWFGWRYVYYGIFAGFVLGAVAAIALLLTRRGTMKTQLPFGPTLMLGPLVVLAFDLVPSFQ